MRAVVLFPRQKKPQRMPVINHKLMMRTGLDAGSIFHCAPMGLRIAPQGHNRVAQKVNRAGAVEMLMSSRQPAELWRKLVPLGQNGLG